MENKHWSYDFNNNDTITKNIYLVCDLVLRKRIKKYVKKAKVYFIKETCEYIFLTPKENKEIIINEILKIDKRKNEKLTPIFETDTNPKNNYILLVYKFKNWHQRKSLKTYIKNDKDITLTYDFKREYKNWKTYTPKEQQK